MVCMDSTLSIIKSISDKNRLRILSGLFVHNELCACQITEFLGVTGATASRHLKLMVNAGVLKNRKQGRWIYFRINTEDSSLTDLLDWVKDKTEKSEQVKQDLKALQQILQVPCDALSWKQRERDACSTTKRKDNA
ncbi:transcriptional regulator [Desulfobacter hydrogenophilus]|uniref:Transcriptional regulator n=2 Tax=Desulfobacter hydrogenophilus TaxID=2291 RepID=A0A328FHN7_9BACT|nr:metalloregulator ArsR/SmtB family transcription factor [Desulfobacter hydrogenophilus]QBH12755.1 ArsR family transcriptional regulator [Desulfobacter hydrogenophilus]RAM02992.1 transcriptional regulator [Desulfobacter hydrogenophilus]